MIRFNIFENLWFTYYKLYLNKYVQITHSYFHSYISVFCEKSQIESTIIISDASIEMRNELSEKGYNEVITKPIIKDVLFEEWDKEVETLFLA